MVSAAQAGAPAGGASIKAHNLMLVWDCIREQSPIGRAGIAEHTGLSKGSMTAMTQQLIDLGLVKSLGEAESVGRGRRVELLVPDGAARAVLAVDLRVDEVACAAMDLGGEVRRSYESRHREALANPGPVADLIAQLAETCRAGLAGQGCEIVAIALVVAAPLWGDPPVIPISVDFGWHGVDLAQLVADRLTWDVPVTLLNDAVASVIAERDALPYPASSMVYLKSNTGIGGAVWANGQVMTGAHGMAFEPGHIVVDPAGPPCACGQSGCLAAVAGPEVVLERAGLSALAAEDGVRAGLRELISRYQAGEPGARAAGAELIRWISQAVTTMRLLFDPDLIVLGGYWAAFAKDARLQLADDWERLGRLFASLWRTDLVRAAQVGERSALAGALTRGVDEVVRGLIGDSV